MLLLYLPTQLILNQSRLPAMYEYHAALCCVYQCFVQITEDKPQKLYLYDYVTALPFTSQRRITFHVTCALNGHCY